MIASRCGRHKIDSVKISLDASRLINRRHSRMAALSLPSSLKASLFGGSSKRNLSSKKIEAESSRSVLLEETSRALAKKAPARSPLTSIKAPNLPAAGRDLEKSEKHSTTHYLKGGTPCDPACPPYRLAPYGEESLYTLVLLRHGESEWNLENKYTGWCDVNLTSRGKSEARDAGRLLQRNGIEIDHAFTSVLRRAGVSCNMALAASGQHWVPVTKSWRLNERHYGALQGYNKDTAYEELDIDQELVMQMRRSYDTPPPPMDDRHVHWHGKDRRYRRLTHDQLEKSRAESLHDTAERIMPFFNSVVVPSLTSGNKCLIVSHANTLRTLIKQIDNISDEDIKQMSIPTGIPLLYRLDKHLKPVDPNIELEFRYMVEPKGYTWATSRESGFHGVYLGDLERLQDIQRKRDATNRDWQRIILRKVAASVLEETEKGKEVMEIRHLWWQIFTKMKNKEFSNMLILVRMKEILEELMFRRKKKFLTMDSFDQIVAKIHLDTEGKVVEPFMELNERNDNEERAREWYETMAVDLEDLEGECLIK